MSGTSSRWKATWWAAPALALLLACARPAPSPEAGPRAAPAWPSYADVPHDICMGERNGHDCAQKVERYQLRHGHPRLERRGSAFRIVLADGDTARIVDEGDPDAPGPGDRRHAYVGYHPAVGQHLVDVTMWEGGHYLLVDPRTGERHVVHALPVVSPDSTRFAVASSSLAYATTGTLEIWRIGEGGVERTWRLEPPEGVSPGPGVHPSPPWSPAEASWLTPASLCVRIDVPSEDAAGAPEGEPAGWVVLEREEGDGGWTFRTHPRELVEAEEATDPDDMTGAREESCVRKRRS